MEGQLDKIDEAEADKEHTTNKASQRQSQVAEEDIEGAA